MTQIKSLLNEQCQQARKCYYCSKTYHSIFVLFVTQSSIIAMGVLSMSSSTLILSSVSRAFSFATVSLPNATFRCWAVTQ